MFILLNISGITNFEKIACIMLIYNVIAGYYTGVLRGQGGVPSDLTVSVDLSVSAAPNKNKLFFNISLIPFQRLFQPFLHPFSKHNRLYHLRFFAIR